MSRDRMWSIKNINYLLTIWPFTEKVLLISGLKEKRFIEYGQKQSSTGIFTSQRSIPKQNIGKKSCSQEIGVGEYITFKPLVSLLCKEDVSNLPTFPQFNSSIKLSYLSNSLPKLDHR